MSLSQFEQTVWHRRSIYCSDEKMGHHSLQIESSVKVITNISKPLSILTQKSPLSSCILPRRRLRLPIYSRQKLFFFAEQDLPILRILLKVFVIKLILKNQLGILAQFQSTVNPEMVCERCHLILDKITRIQRTHWFLSCLYYAEIVTGGNCGSLYQIRPSTMPMQ